MFSEQPASLHTAISAPAAPIDLTFCSAIARLIGGYFTANVPLNPQHVSAPSIAR